MNVIVQSKTVIVTEAIRNFVRHQVQRFSHRSARIGQVTVFLENVAKKKNDVQAASAKILIQLPGKNILVQEKARDLYSAIHAAARSTNEQLHRLKGLRSRKALARVRVPTS